MRPKGGTPRLPSPAETDGARPVPRFEGALSRREASLPEKGGDRRGQLGPGRGAEMIAGYYTVMAVRQRERRAILLVVLTADDEDRTKETSPGYRAVC